MAAVGKAASRASAKATSKTRKHQTPTKLVAIVENAAVTVAKSLPSQESKIVQRVKLFLASPEAEGVARQLFAARIRPSSPNVWQDIRKEFCAQVALFTGLPDAKATEVGAPLFDCLMTTVENTLAAAVEEGSLGAHEALSTARHQIILDELQSIEKNLALLGAGSRPDITTVLGFESRYRQQATTRHAYITPPHFDAARKLPIDDIYVAPRIVPQIRGTEHHPEPIDLRSFLRAAHRAVLLGNPGGGKSTLAVKISHDLASGYGDRYLGGRLLSPILVVLRDYGSERKARRCSVVDFVEATINSSYQLRPPAGVVEYLLASGRAMVVFDGLDELVDTSFRQEITGDIEAFCTLYPAVPVLVTSREVGYEQAPLDERRFEVYRLAPFDEDQVKDYACKWFAADAELTQPQQRQKAEGFIAESRNVADLRSNPLMLALMCNIYRGENYIPRNRPEVYQKCALMLFERWDKSRGILVPLPFEAHIKPAMMYLAHWIYSDESLQSGVTEGQLIATATEYLCTWQYEDAVEAEEAARRFVEFCRGRAWVFTDTGTQKEGERLYQFTHRTFLEYFTAAYLVRTSPLPDVLGTRLLPRISNREWDVVAQLAFQLQASGVEGAADDLLGAVLTHASHSPTSQKWNFLSFAARCLEFMVPRPATTRAITEGCLDESIHWGVHRMEAQEGSLPDERIVAETIAALLYAAPDNRAAVGHSFYTSLCKKAAEGTDHEALIALEIGHHIRFIPRRGMGARLGHGDPNEFWEGLEERVCRETTGKAQVLAQGYLYPALILFWRGDLRLDELRRWHGMDALFQSYQFVVLPHTFLSSVAAVLLDSVVRVSPSAPSKHHARYLALLDEIGTLLPHCSLPWTSAESVQTDPLPSDLDAEYTPRRSKRAEAPTPLNGRRILAVFALIATYAEAAETDGKLDALLATIKKSRGQFFAQHMRWCFVARFQTHATALAEGELNGLRLGVEARRIVDQWMRRELDFVQPGQGELRLAGAESSK